MTARPLLLIGHPGHELLVHDWMREHRPVVMVLTDGSGSANAPRIAETRQVVLEAGATPGPVFGHAPDAEVYAAILRRDAAWFAPLVRQSCRACMEGAAPLVLSDAVEHFNPVHDLASVIAGLACRLARKDLGRAPQRFEFPIERPQDPEALPAGWRLRRLDPAAVARKEAAADGIVALRDEAARRRREQPGSQAFEILAPVAADRPLLPAPEDEPFYERFGRARLAQGVYGELITYAGHLAPLADALDAALRLEGAAP
ncbi:MAG: hypothetical protein JSR86_15760 [Proteobacteria bacterium]|nr:hypothetical protein [Pseudomonadota bacterium]